MGIEAGIKAEIAGIEAETEAGIEAEAGMGMGAVDPITTTILRPVAVTATYLNTTTTTGVRARVAATASPLQAQAPKRKTEAPNFGSLKKRRPLPHLPSSTDTRRNGWTPCRRRASIT